MNNIYDDNRVITNHLQSYKNVYLLVFANEEYIGVSTNKVDIEKMIKPLIQIWNKVEVFSYHKWKCSYEFANKSITMPVSDIKLIYKFLKEHNRAYELPDCVWNLVKEYAGVYNIGCMWNKGHIPFQFWKFSFMYQMLQYSYRCMRKQGKTYNVKKLYRFMKQDFNMNKNIMSCLHQLIIQTKWGYDNDYSSYLKPNDYVLIVDKDL